MTNIPEDLLPPDDESLPASELTVTKKPSMLRSIFFGADGLRAGWSLLTFVLIFAAVAYAAFHIAHTLHQGAPNVVKDKTVGLKEVMENELIPLVITLFVTWIMSKIERRPLSVYGLGGDRKLVNFISGMAWGLTFLSLLVLLLWKTGYLVIEGLGLFGGDLLRYGLGWLAAFLLVGLLEEFLFRGFIQYTLARGLAGVYRSVFKSRHSVALGFWTSAAIWSFLFGFIHKGNPGESPLGLVCASLAALLFFVSLWRTGSLWWAVGLHATWDYAQSFIYGVGDSGLFMRQHLLISHPAGKPLMSGGATGPEGSVFVIPILALAVAVLFLTLPPARRSYLPEHPLPKLEAA